MQLAVENIYLHMTELATVVSSLEAIMDLCNPTKGAHAHKACMHVITIKEVETACNANILHGCFHIYHSTYTISVHNGTCTCIPCTRTAQVKPETAHSLPNASTETTGVYPKNSSLPVVPVNPVANGRTPTIACMLTANVKRPRETHTFWSHVLSSNCMYLKLAVL